MLQFRLILFLLQPSLTSGVLCVALSIGGLVLTGRAFLVHNALLSKYFFGPDGLVTVLQSSPSGFAGLWHSVIGHRPNDNLISYLFVLLIAVAAYTILEGIIKLSGDIGQAAGDARNARLQAKLALGREIARRALLRGVIAAVSFGYALAFLRVILPFCISLSRFGIGAHRWWDAVLAALLLCGALHVIVILARLIILRPRIFGGADEIILIELKR